MRLLLRRACVLLVWTLIAALLAAGGAWQGGLFRNTAAASALPPLLRNAQVLDNDCSGGYVTFTFDDGPAVPPLGNTQLVINALMELHIKAVFFDIGIRVLKLPQVVREEVKDGFLVEDHTWDHASFTGASTDTKPLSLSQVKSELQRGAAAIVAAGAPAPTLYRPPYDDVTAADNWVAASLGLRIVMSYGYPASRIIDSQDWKHLSGKQIARNLTHGYRNESGFEIPAIRAGSILGYHDGMSGDVSANAVASLPTIVRYMNARDLCSTTSVPGQADGGVPATDGSP
jgi:peptidoglycan/xylan/chitin deacetylase (PgdA/CDA1 family)